MKRKSQNPSNLYESNIKKERERINIPWICNYNQKKKKSEWKWIKKLPNLESNTNWSVASSMVRHYCIEQCKFA